MPLEGTKITSLRFHYKPMRGIITSSMECALVVTFQVDLSKPTPGRTVVSSVPLAPIGPRRFARDRFGRAPLCNGDVAIAVVTKEECRL